MSKGVIIVAHGSPEVGWAQELQTYLASSAKDLGQVELVFVQDGLEQSLYAAVNRLEARGINRIKVIPLLAAPVGGHLQDLAAFCAKQADLELGSTLNRHPLVIKLLGDRYSQTWSRTKPHAVGVILVGHGIHQEELRGAWTDWAAGLAEDLFLQINTRPEIQRVSYASCYPDTLRSKAEKYLRQNWTPVVLPLFLGSGLYTQKILPDKLAGLPCLIGAPYLPHPAIAQWVASEINRFLLAHPHR